MASHKKFKADVAYKILRHIEREPYIYKNKDVDISRSHLNKVLMDRGYDYYKKRLSQIHHTNRKDLVTLCGVVVTLPKTLNYLTIEDQDYLFLRITDFLMDRYGNNNSINAIVHRDEAGQPHLHFTFIPVTKNDNVNANMVKVVNYLKENPESNNTQVAKALGISRKTVIRWRPMVSNPVIFKDKLSAFDVVNREELTSFHPDLKKWLNENIESDDGDKIGNHFVTGITSQNGGNRTIEQLKEDKAYYEYENQLKSLREENSDLKKAIEIITTANNELQEEKRLLQEQLAKAEEQLKVIEEEKAREQHNLGLSFSTDRNEEWEF